jgi:predicted GH43/DUF377 family glycosyl hydrolase
LNVGLAFTSKLSTLSLPDEQKDLMKVVDAAAFTADNSVHILYRAMGADNISRIGLASSSDGYHIDERLPLPVFSPLSECENEGSEDPRLTLLDGTLIMAYTAFGIHSQHRVYQISLTSINVTDFLARRWQWSEKLLAYPGIHNKDAVIFPSKGKRRIRDVSPSGT